MSNRRATTLDPEATPFETSPPSPIFSNSCASECPISTFSETVISDSSLGDGTSLDQSKPRVKFPPAPSYISPTYEEEFALFEKAAAPRIRLPSFTPVFNIAATAMEARQKISISSKCDFPEDEARAEPEGLFDGIVRVCLPPSQDTDVVPSVEEEKELFTDTTSPVIRLPSIDFGVHTIVTPSDACETISVSCYHSAPEVQTRAEVDNELFDKVVRIHLPSPQCIDVAPTVEEEKELFTPSIAPVIRLPLFTSSLHTGLTTSVARKAISISSCRDFPEDMAREEPEDLFDRIFRIRIPFITAESVEENAVSAHGDDRDEASNATPEITIAPEQQAVTPQKLHSRQNPEALDFVPGAQLESKTVSSPRYPASKLNPDAPSFVPEKKQTSSTLNPEASEFVPGKKSAKSTLNPEASEFVPEKKPTSSVLNAEASKSVPLQLADLPGEAVSFDYFFDSEASEVVPAPYQPLDAQPEVLGYSVGAAEYVPLALSTLNPEAPDFHPVGRYKTPLNPEAAEFVPTPNPAQYLQSARSTIPDLAISTPAPSISPQCFDDRREAWLTEELFNYGLDNFGQGIEVHHYSFLGHPVMCKTNTPPATSLAILCGEPKLKEGYMLNQDDLHRHAMLYNALHLLDPVVYRGSADLLYDLKGSALENAAVGLVSKTYSGHGWWGEDHYDEDEDMPEYDPLNVHQYGEEMYFNATHRLNYLTQPRALKEVDHSTTEAERKQTRREIFARVKSRMLQVMSANDNDDTQGDNNNVVVDKEECSLAGAQSAEIVQSSGPVEDEPLVDEERNPEQVEAKAFVPDADVESVSEAETVDPVIPELMISPLKIRKTSSQAPKVIDKSLTISPLKPRKASDESTSSTNTTGTDQIQSSSDHADDSPAGNTSGESGQSTPATTDSEDGPLEVSHSLVTTTSSSASKGEQVVRSKAPRVPVVAKPSTSRALIRAPAAMNVVFNNGLNAIGGSIPIASALRPNHGARPRNSADPFGPLQDVPIQVNKYLVPDDPPWEPSAFGRNRIPRSPECNNLKGAVARPDLMRGDEYKIVVLSDPLPGPLPVVNEEPQKDQSIEVVQEESEKEMSDPFEIVQPHETTTHVPHQLSPIKEVREESPNKDFFRHDSKDITELGGLGAHQASTKASAEVSSSPVRSLPIRMKRRATVSNLRVVAEEQEQTPSTRPAHTTALGLDGSPIKRPAAPTPSRMFRLPEPETDYEEEAQDSVNKQDNGSFTSPGPDIRLAVSTVEDSEGLETPVSPSPLPQVNSKFQKRVPSRAWLSGKILQGPPTQLDHGGDDTPRPVTPPTITLNDEPNTFQQQALAPATHAATPASQIGLAVPYYPSEPTLAGPKTSSLTAAGAITIAPPAPFGSSVQASFDHSEPVEPSPSKSTLERVFTDFSGFHPTALDYGESSGDFAVAVEDNVASPDEAQPPLTTHDPTTTAAEPVTEHILPTQLSPVQFPPTIAHPNTPPSPASEASVSSSKASITSNETVIHTFATAKAREQQRSVRDVLFRRPARIHGSVWPAFRSSSWGKVENKLRKKSVATTTVGVDISGGLGMGEGQGAMKNDMVKDVKRGKFGRWADRVFGRGKQLSKQ